MKPPVEIPYDRFVDWDGRCPDCGGSGFLEGPRANSCVHLQCLDCGSWLNALDLKAIWRVDNRRMAHRIRKEDR